jgi:hypothetical protein
VPRATHICRTTWLDAVEGFQSCGFGCSHVHKVIIGMNPGFYIVDLDMIKMRRVPYDAAWYRS